MCLLSGSERWQGEDLFKSKRSQKVIKREHFKLSTHKQIMAQFANAKLFSKLDASPGFWQLKLDEASSILSTVNTPFAKYNFTYL